MIQTDHYNFNKPDSEDRVSISDLNQNMDTLDVKLHDIEIAKVDKSRILTTMEEIEAVTEDGFLADARCVSVLNNRLPIFALGFHAGGTKSFSFKSRFNNNAVPSARQSVFAFFTVNGSPIYGLLTIYGSDSTVQWNGTGTVTATLTANGRVNVTLTATLYDKVTLLSGDVITA